MFYVEKYIYIVTLVSMKIKNDDMESCFKIPYQYHTLWFRLLDYPDDVSKSELLFYKKLRSDGGETIDKPQFAIEVALQKDTNYYSRYPYHTHTIKPFADGLL